MWVSDDRHHPEGIGIFLDQASDSSSPVDHYFGEKLMEAVGKRAVAMMALIGLLLLFLSAHAGVEGRAPPEERGEGFHSNQIGEECSKQGLVLHQAATTPLPSGILTYTVWVVNICATGCSISDVHLACGWFSTARSINPAIVRRLNYNDCLLNDGKPIPPRGSVSFQYAQTYPYTLSVSSATCNP